MILRDQIPTFNASMNAIALLLLTIGFILVKRRRLIAHRNVMLAAVAVSACFLAGYLTYHLSGESRRYVGEWGAVYYPILISHVILAAFVPVGACVVLFRAFRNELDKHRLWAKVTLPIWWYVSLTGIVVYWMVHT